MQEDIKYIFNILKEFSTIIKSDVSKIKKLREEIGEKYKAMIKNKTENTTMKNIIDKISYDSIPKITDEMLQNLEISLSNNEIKEIVDSLVSISDRIEITRENRITDIDFFVKDILIGIISLDDFEPVSNNNYIHSIEIGEGTNTIFYVFPRDMSYDNTEIDRYRNMVRFLNNIIKKLENEK